MKWVAALLMVANVLLFLGVSDRQVESAVVRSDARPDVNRESMRLLKETEAGVDREPGNGDASPAGDGASASGVGADAAGDGLPATVLEGDDVALVTIDSDGIARREAEPDNDAASGGSPSPAAGEAPADGSAESAALAPATDLSCYRVGPFRNTNDWEAAVAWVDGQGWTWEQVRSESRELRAVRVYIGPYESIGAAQPTIDMLKDKDLDHFVYLRESQARISLGYFTQEELADKYVDYLTGLGIDARSQPEYRTLGPFDWMDLSIDSAMRRGLGNHQWGDEGVHVTEKPCQPAA